MPDKSENPSTSAEPATEPRGFGEHARGLAGEYAHEQGWGINVEERTHTSDKPQDLDGGTDYEYGARDFGDEPVNTALNPDDREPTQNAAPANSKASTETGDSNS